MKSLCLCTQRNQMCFVCTVVQCWTREQKSDFSITLTLHEDGRLLLFKHFQSSDFLVGRLKKKTLLGVH